MARIRLTRIITARPIFFASYALGAICFFVFSLLQMPAGRAIGAWDIRAIGAWDIGSTLFLVLTFFDILRTLNRDITADAKAHQEAEWTVFALTVLGAVASFAAIILLSHSTHDKSHIGAHVAFVVATITLSWLTTNVIFAFRYAHEYYSFDNKGKTIDRGIIFPDDDQPDYLDFIYFAFVLGMTFQVSDCNITAKKLRRLATVQGLIGLIFNTVILALSVNIAASLL
jgi:uncharacterized membrane protein